METLATALFGKDHKGNYYAKRKKSSVRYRDFNYIHHTELNIVKLFTSASCAGVFYLHPPPFFCRRIPNVKVSRLTRTPFLNILGRGYQN